MTDAFTPPDGLVYLPLQEEALPLLKRGVIPLRPASHCGLSWLAPAQQQADTPARVSEADYLQHLRQEYARLPGSLRGLLSEEAFIAQAGQKRLEIEAALLAQRQQQQVQHTGSADDWLLQRFYPNPYSGLTWELNGGFSAIWLGLDPQQWPEAQLQPVSYQPHLAAAYPQRLLNDSPEAAFLGEQRWLQAVAATEKLITVAGVQQGLVRLPPKALRCVLFGSQVRPAYARQFGQYWLQDFRYQRIPLVRMSWLPDQFSWVFRPFTRSENA